MPVSGQDKQTNQELKNGLFEVGAWLTLAKKLAYLSNLQTLASQRVALCVLRLTHKIGQGPALEPHVALLPLCGIQPNTNIFLCFIN